MTQAVNSYFPRVNVPIDVPEPFPAEVWYQILSFVIGGERANFQQVVSYGSVCRFFLQFCLDSIAYDRLQFILGKVKAAELPEPAPLVLDSMIQLRNSRLLAVGSDGKHYLKCTANLSQHILYILEFSDDQKKFIVRTLDLVKEIYDVNSVEIPKGDGNPEFLCHLFQEIVACHTTEDGFMVITLLGASIWTYSDSGIPQFQGFFTPFETSQNDNTIRSYGYLNHVLYLNYSTNSFILDLNQIEPKLIPILELEDNNPSHLFCTGKKTYLQSRGEMGYVLHQVEAQETEMEGVLQKQLVPVGTPARLNGKLVSLLQMKGWILGKDPKGFFIHSEENLMANIAQEERVTWNAFCEMRGIFMCGNFLFLIKRDTRSTNPDNLNFLALHLPTKTDCSEQFLRLLGHYLENPDVKLLSVNVRFDQEKGMLLDLLLLEPSEDAETICSVTFPLEKINAEPAKKPPSRLPSLQAATSTVTAPTFSRVSPCPSTDGKIEINAASALLVLTTAFSAILLVWHPGTVLFKVSGVILTLPALLTFALGGSASLVIFAIGSYRFWKSQRASIL